MMLPWLVSESSVNRADLLSPGPYQVTRVASEATIVASKERFDCAGSVPRQNVDRSQLLLDCLDAFVAVRVLFLLPRAHQAVPP